MLQTVTQQMELFLVSVKGSVGSNGVFAGPGISQSDQAQSGQMMSGQGNVGIGGPGTMTQQQLLQSQQQQLLNQQQQQAGPGGLQQQQQQNHMMTTPDMRRTFDTLGLNAAGGIAQSSMGGGGGPGQMQMGFGVARMPGPGSGMSEMGNGNGPQMSTGGTGPTCMSPQQGIMAGNRVRCALGF